MRACDVYTAGKIARLRGPFFNTRGISFLGAAPLAPWNEIVCLLLLLSKFIDIHDFLSKNDIYSSTLIFGAVRMKNRDYFVRNEHKALKFSLHFYFLKGQRWLKFQIDRTSEKQVGLYRPCSN